jgi:hypothetical protein
VNVLDGTTTTRNRTCSHAKNEEKSDVDNISDPSRHTKMDTMGHRLGKSHVRTGTDDYREYCTQAHFIFFKFFETETLYVCCAAGRVSFIWILTPNETGRSIDALEADA